MSGIAQILACVVAIIAVANSGLRIPSSQAVLDELPVCLIKAVHRPLATDSINESTHPIAERHLGSVPEQFARR